MSTQNMFLWRNKKNILWIPLLVWNYGKSSNNEPNLINHCWILLLQAWFASRTDRTRCHGFREWWQSFSLPPEWQLKQCTLSSTISCQFLTCISCLSLRLLSIWPRYYIASDKTLFQTKKDWYFSYFSIKTDVVVLIRSTLVGHF